MFNIIGADGKQYGPVSADQIRQWIREGRANGASQVQPVGGADWKSLASLPEFADAFASGTGAPPPMAASSAGVSSRASNKIAAGICGILLGGLGVHKFILGYSNTGAIMLGVTLGGFVIGFFTCGVTFLASSAMGIIGLVEGIIYLTKSDEDFVRTYVDGRKEWF
jgi:TM2 domain-containing membrane protein YozV